MPAPVVVVHHQSDIREQVLHALRTAGFAVAGFDDPMTTLDTIETSSQARVLITSVNFRPGQLNGVALTRMLRTKRPNLQVIFVAPPENGHHARGMGAILATPVDPEALVEQVEQLLAA